MKKIIAMCSLGIITLAAVPSALAYLDPGSGSMILQVLIGGLAAMGIVLKTQWVKLKSFFKKPKE
ncbi:MAG TPA: hypothetical protein VJH68_04000 [Candidatus Nanoarchaeia archaeon]|nr:hypothetical protein [Candidatus Nanoarchaeia archaeon]